MTCLYGRESTNPPATQHALSVIEYDGLSRGDSELRLRELHAHAVVAQKLDNGFGRRVQVANLCPALEMPRDLIDQPVEAVGNELGTVGVVGQACR